MKVSLGSIYHRLISPFPSVRGISGRGRLSIVKQWFLTWDRDIRWRAQRNNHTMFENNAMNDTMRIQSRTHFELGAPWRAIPWEAWETKGLNICGYQCFQYIPLAPRDLNLNLSPKIIWFLLTISMRWNDSIHPKTLSADFEILYGIREAN